MATQDEHGPVDMTKPSHEPDPEPDFDPYRYGLPEHPVPPEFAPPGYRPPPAAEYPPGPAGRTAPPNPAGYPPPWYPSGSAPPPGYAPPPWNDYSERRGPGHNSARSAWALGCGIASLALCWLSFLDVVLLIPAFVLGGTVLADKRSTSRGLALAGVICAVVGAVAAIVLTVLYAHLGHACSGLSGTQLRQCVHDHL